MIYTSKSTHIMSCIDAYVEYACIYICIYMQHSGHSCQSFVIIENNVSIKSQIYCITFQFQLV